MGRLAAGWEDSRGYDVPIYSTVEDESDKIAKRLDRGEVVKVEKKNMDGNMLADIAASLKKDLLALNRYQDKRDEKVWWLKARKTARRIAYDREEKKPEPRNVRQGIRDVSRQMGRVRFPLAPHI